MQFVEGAKKSRFIKFSSVFLQSFAHANFYDHHHQYNNNLDSFNLCLQNFTADLFPFDSLMCVCLVVHSA
jgi:hypothetical protein